MNCIIRLMTREDAQHVIDMMRVFYASPAVLSNGSEEIFRNDVENCVNDSPYLEGYIIEDGQKILGYGMIAKSFSTEFGKPCMWIEDLYLKEEARAMASVPSCVGTHSGRKPAFPARPEIFGCRHRCH